MSISNYLTTCGPLSGPLPHCPWEWWNKAQCFITGSRSVWWKLWEGEEAHVKLLQLVLLHHLNWLPSLRYRICIHTGQDILMPFQTPDLSHPKLFGRKHTFLFITPVHWREMSCFFISKARICMNLHSESTALFIVFSVTYYWKVMPRYDFLLRM